MIVVKAFFTPNYFYFKKDLENPKSILTPFLVDLRHFRCFLIWLHLKKYFVEVSDNQILTRLKI